MALEKGSTASAGLLTFVRFITLVERDRRSRFADAARPAAWAMPRVGQVITTLSLVQARRLSDVDGLADDRGCLLGGVRAMA